MLSSTTKDIYVSNHKEVYVDGKLVGAALTAESEAAIRRLMSFPTKEDKK